MTPAIVHPQQQAANTSNARATAGSATAYTALETEYLASQKFLTPGQQRILSRAKKVSHSALAALERWLHRLRRKSGLSRQRVGR